MPPRPAHRPLTLTVEQTDQIAAMIANGVPPGTAAGAVGIARDRYQEWMRMGEDERADAVLALPDEQTDLPPAIRPSRRDFYERVTRAKAEAVRRNVVIVTAAAVTDWKAAAWMLERQDRAHWGAQPKVAGDGEVGPLMKYASPKAELTARLTAIRERLAEGHVPVRDRPEPAPVAEPE